MICNTQDLSGAPQDVVQSAINEWVAYDRDAELNIGFPLKAAAPVFRLSRDGLQWESSWGFNVPLAEINKAEFLEVLQGTRHGTAVGEYGFRADGPDHFKLGCFRITRETAQELHDKTP